MNDTNTKNFTIDASATLSKLNAFEHAIATIRQLYNERGELIEQQRQTIADLRAQLDAQNKPKPDIWPLYAIDYSVVDAVKPDLHKMGIKPAYNLHLTQHYGLTTGATDENGWIILTERDAFIEAVRARVPADHTGPVWFDIEGKLERDADAGNPDAIARMLEIYERGKAARPNALWGIYGYPKRSYYDENGGLDENLVRARVQRNVQHPIAKAVDICSPNLYEYGWGQPWIMSWVQSSNRINLEVMREHAKGRPIVAFVMPTYHMNGNYKSDVGGTLVHPDRYAATIKGARKYGADAVVFWDDPNTRLRTYPSMFMGTWPPENDPYYWICLRHRAVLAHEKPFGVPLEQHIETVNRWYLCAMSAAWNGQQLPDLPPVNLGPVKTQLPPKLNFGFVAPNKPHVLTGEHGAIVLDRVSDVVIRDVTVTTGSAWAIKVNNAQTSNRVAVRGLRGEGLTEYCMYFGGARNWTMSDLHLDRTDNAKEHGLRIAGSENIMVVPDDAGRRNYLGGASKSIIWVVSCQNLHVEAIDLGKPSKPVGAIRLGARPDVVDANSATLRIGDRQGGVIRYDGQWIQPPPKSTNLTLRDVSHWHNGNDNHALCVWPGPESFVIEDYLVWTKAGRAIHFDSRWSGRAVLRNIKINGEPLDWKHIDTGGRPLDELQARVTIEHSPVEGQPN